MTEEKRSTLTGRSPAAPSMRSCKLHLCDAMIRNPVMFVVLVGSVLTRLIFLRDAGRDRRRERRFAGMVALAVVHGPVRQLRGGRRRGSGQGPGRLAAQGQGRHGRRRVRRADGHRGGAEPAAHPRRRVRRQGGRGDPRRRRGDRGHRRSTSRPSPASRRRSSASGGDRSAVTAAPVLSDGSSCASRPRRDVPRPHDRLVEGRSAGRRRRTRSRSTSCSPG